MASQHSVQPTPGSEDTETCVGFQRHEDIQAKYKIILKGNLHVDLN